MEIRIAQPEDTPGIIALLHQVGEVHHRIRPDIFRSGALKYDEKALETLLSDKSKPIFVAAEEKNVLGYCFCQLRDHRGSGVQTDRLELYIDDLCVDETHRGQGIATALYHHVRNFAQVQRCAFITLNVWCGNDNAQHFYTNLGMTPRNVMMETKL